MQTLEHLAASKSGAEAGRRKRKLDPPGEASEPRPIRRSRRLQEQSLCKQWSSSASASPDKTQLQRINERRQDVLLSPSPSWTTGAGYLHPSIAPLNTSIGNRKRKAEPIVENTESKSQALDEPPSKRHHADHNTTISNASPPSDRVSHWVAESYWPEGDFESDPPMARPPSKRSRSSSSQAPQWDAGTMTPSDQKPREEKSAPYTNPRYQTGLELKNSFMKDSENGISVTEKEFCDSLLHTTQEAPSDTLFDDNFFSKTCGKIENKNETRVIRDISTLITPSAEILATRGMRELSHLVESTNAGWNKSIPFEGPRPQPDYSVGFHHTVFTKDHRERLNPDFNAKTYFTATDELYFPFLTSEIKCGNQALDTADRQNAHNMTVAVRGLVELYRIVRREGELHRKVLGFSISHDHRNVRIYAHYPEIHGRDTRYYRRLLKSFDIISEDGKERWTANQFTRNVYDVFVPKQLDRIKSAVDQMPDHAPESSQSTQSAEDVGDWQQTMAPSAPSSQDTGTFREPLPRKAGGLVAAELREQLQQAKQREEQQREDSTRREEKFIAQLEQQRKESEQQRRESEQKWSEIVELLKQDRGRG